MEELYAQFKARADLEAKVADLEAKLAAAELAPAKKSRKPKDPNAPPKEPKPKKGGLPPEELAERRRQNGLRLAASNRARREAEHQAWLAQQLEQKKTSGSEPESCESESEPEPETE